MSKKFPFQLIVRTKTMKLIAVFRYMAWLAFIVPPKKVLFFIYVKFSLIFFLINPPLRIIIKIMKTTALNPIRPMNINVDIFAKKLVDSIDEDSSLALILFPLNPINSLKLKSFTKFPITTSGFIMLKVIRPLN